MTKYEVIHQSVINCQFSKPFFYDNGGEYQEYAGSEWEDEDYCGEVGNVIEVDEQGYFNEDKWRFVKDVEWYVERGYIRKV